VLSGLENRLESPVEKVFEIYIRTTPGRLSEAITDPGIRSKYNFGARQRSDWTPGSRCEMWGRPPMGSLGKVKTSRSTARRPVGSMVALWSDEVGAPRVTWGIEPIGDSCHLTVTHDQLRDDANAELYGGWPMILSGLKIWLETGELLTTPGSLLYG